MYLKNFLFLFLIIILSSCAKDTIKKSVINEKNLNTQVLEAYKEGMKSLEQGDVLFAAKKFNEVEILYPQSQWAPKSSIMAAYAYYSQSYFSRSIGELERYLDKYKNHKDRDYAYYLLALCYYDQIVDEKKDLKSIIDSKKYFEKVINNYPNTDFAIDSEFKMQVIDEILASKEMYIARYYVDKEKWVPASNRFKKIINQYRIRY